MKILIVDDDDIMRRTLTTRLKRAGHDIWEAHNGAAAWELLQREHIRLAIVDWCMPVMDGLELVRRIRVAALPGYVYIIMLTVRCDKEDVIAGLEAGADDYLTKPFNADELLARLEIGKRILDLEARLTETALRDGLTGLFNRRAFDARLDEEVHRAQRYSRPLTLVMSDIDHFKKCNDTRGHPEGDRLLNELALVIGSCVRRADFVARFGGEEFAIILPETPKANALIVAEAIRATVESYPFSIGMPVTLSLGVAGCPDDAAEYAGLLRRADQALYRAKQSGRNRVSAAATGETQA